MRFTSVLVANRGEIARRILRAARQSGLSTVAVYVAADADAPFVSEADEAVLLPTSYLDGDAVLTAARHTRVQALHPGYGFLSENAEFASAVVADGLVWVGPSPAVVGQVGDKLAAKEIARAAGVPILESSEDESDAERVGYPLMIKAAAGGGGKGMRVVRSPRELDDSLAAARREALAGFSDDRVFLERYVASARHVEVQILGDEHGNLVHLGERDCSIQRRHQKLIEESPSPAIDDASRRAICDAALAVAREIGYQSAGTVEFLVDDESKEFFFLEVNARLQVEHPVSELVSGVDIVREQFRIAQGEVLGYDQDDIRFRGHAIEVRLCAEDPETGFLPATGTLCAFEAPIVPALRWESGVKAGSRVTVDFDPLLAKVISHAPQRREAAASLALGLERLHLGGVTTNRDFLVNVLRSQEFLEGDATTDFVDRVDLSRTLELPDDEFERAAAAGALWLQGLHRRDAQVLSAVPSGWRNARLPRQSATLIADEPVTLSYQRRRDGTFDLGDLGSARIHEWSPAHIDIEINARRRSVRITHANGHLYVQSLRGTIDFSIAEKFEVRRNSTPSGGLSAPMPGRILAVAVEPGQEVVAGQTLIVMEAMKMEHVIAAPCDGVVNEVLVRPDQQVERGASLLTLHEEGE
jgi:propionyl-CoA carboxylase alpha chain